jgi:predicted nucleic acid-binding protein
VNQKRALDSFALLAYLNQESGFERVRMALAKARQSDHYLIMNEISIGETYYILYRKRGEGKAEYFLENILPGLPIRVVHNDFQQVIDAARIKAQYPISFADCFAVTTASRENALIITGDPEFKKIDHLVGIEWLHP